MAQFINPVVGVVSTVTSVATIVSALKVSSRGNTKSAKEFDDCEREAYVYLYTCRLPALPDEIEFHHWAIVLEFEGKDIRTAEGLVNEESLLYAVYTKEPPKEEGSYYLLGKVFLSPKNVLQMCESNEYNSLEYLPTWQNCQSWVKKLAEKLGKEISLKLDDYPTLKEVRPIFASIVKGSTAFGNFSSRPLHKAFSSSKATSGPKDKTS